MKSVLLPLVLCLLLLPIQISAEDEATNLGSRRDTRIVQEPETEVICPATSLLKHDDGSFENGYCWRFMGAVPPDYGSFAECYEGEYICAIEFFLTQTGYYNYGQTMDVYVWESDATGNPPPGPDPGNVICVLRDVSPGPVALWPDISKHDIEVCCSTNGQHFVGYWGTWGAQTCAWFMASDEDGPGVGCPRTKIAPGIGYPTGWQHPNIIPTFENCKDLGIRVYRGRGDCETSSAPDPDGAEPPRKTTWGKVKSLY